MIHGNKLESDARQNALRTHRGQPDAGPVRAPVLESDCANVLRLRTLLALSCVVLHRLPVLQISEPVTNNVGIVDEEILASVFRCDESVTLLLTEPLHCTVGQTSVLLDNFGHAEPSPSSHTLSLVRRTADGIEKCNVS